MRSIKRRITLNFIFISVITVVILELFLLSIVKENYYKNLEDSLYNQVRVSSDLYSTYFSDSSLHENILNNVDIFWKRTQAQVEILDKNGRVLMDSIDQVSSEVIQTEDVVRAIRGDKGAWIGRVDYYDHKVMAVAYPLKSGDNIVGVLRLIAPLKEVNEDIRAIGLMFIGFGLVVIVICGLVSVLLAETIVGPLKDVTSAAEKMALGDFQAKSIKKYDDEIGRLSDTLNFMADEIIKKEELKNNFISSISHELRTPLTSIKGWAVTLKHSQDNMEILTDGLNIIEDESDRLSDMVEELLDFSKFISGRVELIKERVNIYQLIDQVGKQLRPRAERDNIDFRVDIEEDMPETWSDSNRLKQIFINLLDNAFKFTPPGGQVSLGAGYQDGDFIFHIRDTGHGIGEEDLPNIKEKFYKGKASQSQSGIGLSICDEIIKLMEGSFEIKSQVGKGTQIKVTIPRRPS